MKAKEIRERLAALAKEGSALAAKHEKDGLTDDEASRVSQIRQEATDLRSKLTVAVEQEQSFSDFRAMDDEYNKPAVTSRRELVHDGAEQRGNAAGVETRGEPAHWTMGDRFVNSQGFQEFRQRVGMGTSMRPLPVGSFYEPHQRRAALDAAPPEQRALITSVTVTEMIQPDRLAGIVEGLPRRLRARDVMANRQTGSNMIEFVRRATTTNNAAEVAEATSLVTGLKPESGFTLESDSAPVRTIAHLEYATRQALDDMAQLRGIIEGDLRRGIEEREDLQLLYGDGVAPNLRGVYNTPGIQNLDAAYWTANPLPTDGAAANRWDRLIRAITRVDETGRSVASAVVLNPSEVERIRVQKDTQGNYLFAAGGPFATGTATIWGLPIVPHSSQPAGTFLLGDFARHATVYDRMAAQVYVTDSNRDLFERNIITFLAEGVLS
jgi:HK97 family phage major capsid protein